MGTFNTPSHAPNIFSSNSTRERIRDLREKNMGRGIPESHHGQATAKGFLSGNTGHPGGGGGGPGGGGGGPGGGGGGQKGGGGGQGGGGGGPGGNPPQGNPVMGAPQNGGHDDRLMGAPPEIFDGNPADADRFVDAFKQYCRLNSNTAVMRSWVRRTALALTYIQGPKVAAWAIGSTTSS